MKTIQCSNCLLPLLNVIERSDAKENFTIVVHCWACKDKSYHAEVAAPFSFGRTESTILKNQEVKDEIIHFYTSEAGEVQ